MKLIDVYERDGSVPFATVDFLYQLLAEREPSESISHRVMPTFEEHIRFVESQPYRMWFIAEQEGQRVGAVYLSRARELGIAISKAQRGRGLGSLALSAMLLRVSPGRVLANINPANEASIALFRKHGFGGPTQITLEKP